MDVIELSSDEESVGDVQVVAANVEHRVTVDGPPVPMPRHKTTPSHSYNPAATKLLIFRSKAKASLVARGVTEFPVMADIPVSAEIWFCMRLPNTAFVNGDRLRLRGELNRTDVAHYSSAKPDVDNLVKFALDGLKGVAFRDAKSVVSVTAYKCYDNNYPFEGKTMIVFKEATRDTVKQIPNW